MMIERNKPLEKATTEEKIIFYFIGISIVLIYALQLEKGQNLPSFKKKIEDYLCDLFPHSSNENYARHNLPIANQIRT